MEYILKYGDLLFKYKGTLYDSTVTNKESLERLNNYEDIRDDDVIVWTYPKSGTHAALDVVWKIVFDGDLDKYATQSGELWFEVCPPDYLGPHNPAATFTGSLEDLSAAKSPRVIATHVHFDLFPKKVQDGKTKIIYVSRNPKDVCVSLYEMGVKLLEMADHGKLDWSTYGDYFVDENYAVFGTWAEHLKSFHAVKDKSNILWVKYEDLIADYRGQTQRISNFLERKLSEEVIAKIADSCKFETVKKQFPDSMFLRKGISGDWKEHFTVAQSERFEQKIRADLGSIADEVLN